MKLDQSCPSVLFVDDDQTLLRGITRSLADHDLKIETAISVAEAKAILNHIPVDVLVCDQNMPGTSGLEFLQELRETRPDIISIMLSGHVDGIPVAIKWAEDIGVYKVIAKPCNADAIADVVLSAFASKQQEDAAT